MNLMILLTILVFVILSILYVYKYRGEARYVSFNEYLRKGWPIFSPFNSLLYLFTKAKAKKPIMDVKDFPELKEITDNWEVIRDEAVKLKEMGFFDKTKSTESGAYYDLGFRTFIKYGWSKFYIFWYGHNHKSAKKLCPKTQEIVSKNPLVSGAMFSLLPSGSKLTRHLDPIASSLRFHVSLDTPNDENCFINVDGKQYFWKDSDGFLFDETYIHYANNNTDKDRVILMCDIKRPLYFPGNLINIIAQFFLKATVVPNVEGDRKGLVNFIFSSITPIMQQVRSLKKDNILLYKIIKYAVNISLLCILVLLTMFTVNLASKIF